MPCYDYKCPKCEEYFELIIQYKVDEELNSDADKECPKCGTVSPRQFGLPPGSKSHLKFLYNYMEPTDN
jgi:predicted nucleic acid-binding Zn ribbon protein